MCSHHPSPETGDPAGDETRQADAERAVERLLEDEALRGDLTDDGYGPLLDAIVDLAIARADRFSSTDDLYLALRHLLAGAVEAAQSGDPAAVLETAAPPLIEEGERVAVAMLLPDPPGPPDEAAAMIAQALTAATGPAEAPPDEAGE